MLKCTECGNDLCGNNVKPGINMPTHYCSKCNKYFTITTINENNKIQYEYNDTVLLG